MKANKKRVTMLEVRHRYLPEPEPEELTAAEEEKLLFDLFIDNELRFEGSRVTTTDPDLQGLADDLNAAMTDDMLFFPLTLDETQRAMVAFDADQLAVTTLQGYGRMPDRDEVRRVSPAPDAVVPLGWRCDRMLAIVNAQLVEPFEKTTDNIKMLLQWRLDMEGQNAK